MGKESIYSFPKHGTVDVPTLGLPPTYRDCDQFSGLTAGSGPAIKREEDIELSGALNHYYPESLPEDPFRISLIG